MLSYEKTSPRLEELRRIASELKDIRFDMKKVKKMQELDHEVEKSKEDAAMSALSNLSSIAGRLGFPDLMKAFFESKDLRLELESENEKMKLLDKVNIRADHLKVLENGMKAEDMDRSRRRDRNTKRRNGNLLNVDG